MSVVRGRPNSAWGRPRLRHALNRSLLDLEVDLFSAVVLHARCGGYPICDTANRYRTALDLLLKGETDRVARMPDTGQFSRPDGLTDHRFSPREPGDLFETCGLRIVQVAGLCPFFSYLPGQEQVSILDGEQVYAVNCTARRCKRSPRVTQQSRP